MDHAQHTAIVNLIWGVADDVLRDVYVRGKYRDVILPMTVIRRLDSLLEPTKDDVLAMKRRLDEMGVESQDQMLAKTAGEAFYNTSPFTLRRLLDNPKQLRANFEAYLDGFSPNVQEILDKFKFRFQLGTLDEADALGHLIRKFIDPGLNLSPKPTLDAHGKVKLAGLDNHAMGTIFEELIRRFNEENNEEAGEHFTPRDVVTLMANLILLPAAESIESGTYLVYDGACGTGGMLTVAEETLRAIAEEQGKEVAIHLYGQEVNPETFAITKADLLLKGEGADADNMRFGSTLANDGFPGRSFDFMLSNPPYGKSWKKDLDTLGGKDGMHDPRFVVEHGGEADLSLVTRTSDGQMLFLVNMLQKMKHDTRLGSRIAEVHNGSALFTGDAGQGESNIRRWIIENDWLEAIVALPLNIFYNTGIATYIWILTNKKPAHRQGKLQLIDATSWFRPLRRNLGKKNCELSPEDIGRIRDAFQAFKETEQSKIFLNEEFGYWKLTVERPLRLRVNLDALTREKFRKVCRGKNDEALATLIDQVAEQIGPGPHLSWDAFMDATSSMPLSGTGKLTAARKKLIQTELAARDEGAEPVVRRKRRASRELTSEERLHGQFTMVENGKEWIVEYEPDPELRDTEQIPFLEAAGIAGFIEREVRPYTADAWVDAGKAVIGYEVSFTRYFYKPKPLRTLVEIETDIRALELETEGLLEDILIRTSVG